MSGAPGTLYLMGLQSGPQGYLLGLKSGTPGTGSTHTILGLQSGAPGTVHSTHTVFGLQNWLQVHSTYLVYRVGSRHTLLTWSICRVGALDTCTVHCSLYLRGLESGLQVHSTYWV